MSERTDKRALWGLLSDVFLSYKEPGFERIVESLKGQERASVALLYVLLVCIAYAPVTFAGRSLQASLFHPYGVLDNWPAGYEGRKPLNTFNIDLTHDYSQWPLNKLLGDMYRQGELPLWNPYQGLGVPLAGQYTVGAFFPYRIIEAVCPVWSWDYFLLGRLWVAGFFTYLFLRQLGLSCTASLLGGIFYMFSGNLIWHVNREDMVDTTMTVPVLFFCLERLMQRQLYRDIALSAGAFSLILLGQPEAALWVMALGACYIAFKGFLTGMKWRARLLSLLLPTLLALGLAAPLILLFLELVSNAVNIHTEGLMGVAGTKQAWSYKLSLIFPTLFMVPTYYRIWPENGAWDYLSGSTGVLSIYLVFLGLLVAFFSKNKSLRWELVFFAGFAVTIVLKNMGVRPFVWLGYLPIINACWSQRWAGPAWSFSLVIAGAIGLEVLKRNLQKSKPGVKALGETLLKETLLYLVRSLWQKVLFAGLIIFLVVSIALELDKIVEKGNYDSFFIPSVVSGCGLALGVLITAILLTLEYAKKGRGLEAFLPLGFLELWYAIPRGYDDPTTNQLWIPLAMGILVILSTALDRFRLTLLGTLLFVLSYLIIDASAYFGLPDRYNPFTEAPYVKHLKKVAGNYRVLGAEGVLMPNYASALGIQDVHYINTVTPSCLHDYVENNLYVVKPGTTSCSFWFTGIGRLSNTVFPELTSYPVSVEEKEMLDEVHRVEKEVRTNLPYYSLLGLKYIIVPKHVTFNTQDLREKGEVIFPLIYHDEVNIYENPRAFPRTFIAHGVEYTNSYREAHALVKKLGLDLRHTAILEESLPTGYKGESHVTGRSSALIKQYGPNKVTIEAHVDSPGVLVLSDLYYPGWKAYVDGTPVKLYRVDGIIRGVLVQEGEHMVEFRYSPSSLKYGLIAFSLSMVVCGGCLITGHKQFT
jgi:hypothetical protein